VSVCLNNLLNCSTDKHEGKGDRHTHMQTKNSDYDDSIPSASRSHQGTLPIDVSALMCSCSQTSRVFSSLYSYQCVCRHNYFSRLHLFSLSFSPSCFYLSLCLPLLYSSNVNRNGEHSKKNCLTTLSNAMTRECIVFMFVT
jgi:hypothetical protein